MKILALSLALAASLHGAVSAEPAAASDPAALHAETLNALRKVEDQQRDILQRLQLSTASSTAELQKSQEVLSQELKQIQANLAEQRRLVHDTQSRFNNLFLISILIAGLVVSIGFISVGVMMLKSIRRMSEVTTSALEAIHPLLLNSGALQRPELPVAGNALLGSVSELDDRIRAMEQRYLPKE